MAPHDANAPEVRESIEAKGARDDEDVDMQDIEDQPADDAGSQDADGDADDDVDADADGEADEDADADADADGEPDDSQINSSGRLPRDVLDLIETTSKYLCDYEEHGEKIAAGFQRIPNKRLLPDYFDVIKEPVAFSSIRGKLNRRNYTNFTEFVRDVALICHNAQVYNRPSAPIFQDALRLREVFKEELQKLVKAGTITADEATLPDFGELPPVEDSPPPEEGDEEDEEVDEDEDEEEDDEDDDDSDEDGGGRRSRRRRGRPSASGRRDKGEDGEDAHKKRGRPPKVLTPMEARIHALLKGLRKVKHEDGELLVTPFEKLPDKAAVPDYYTTIRNPIALDIIKRKAKRKKYQSVDQALADLELMFENAKAYNEEDSEVHQDALELQTHARALAEQEKARPDGDFRDEDGKLPLASIEYNGEVWKVGDWVHIRNPNDLSKPIVAQIYRAWQDGSGQKWVNACWYYRPEQTVHRFEKHFFENEVVKTGQYRDHRIEEVVDRCFVMFITRYHKGRPRGFPPQKEVYVCEARYNEEKFRFNKIKTWASCVPDEVREKDYEMDLFPVPRKLKKFPSPIKHLLRPDAKETDDLPKPTWGSPNAPPIVGAVHRRPREPNESPPPEPTPPPTPAPPPQIHQVASRSLAIQSDRMAGSPAYHPGAPAARPPGMQGPPASYAPHFAPRPMPTPTPSSAPHLQPMPQHITATPGGPGVPSPHGGYQQPPAYSQQHGPGGVVGHTHPSPSPLAPYDHHRLSNTPAMSPSRMPMASTPSTTAIPHANAAPAHHHQHHHHQQYNPPNPPKVFSLPEALERAIPPEVRAQFHRDGQGRLLLFASPPREPAPGGVAPEYRGMGHSVRYLAGLREFREERERKRKARDQEARGADKEEGAKKRAIDSSSNSSSSTGQDQNRDDETLERLLDAGGAALAEFVRRMNRGTEGLRREMGDWEAEKTGWEEERKKLANGKH